MSKRSLSSASYPRTVGARCNDGVLRDGRALHVAGLSDLVAPMWLSNAGDEVSQRVGMWMNEGCHAAWKHAY